MMGLHGRQRRALRLQLRDVLWKFKPDADAIEIGAAVLKVMQVVDQAPLGTFLGAPPVPNCACWQCVLRLQAGIIQTQAQRSVEIAENLELD
jgi:hypothetical protein